ncbi:DUF2238 domain-containing protein [Shewanella violacea]|uniref:Inner membrane protein YjdF n=1 Tax=Shewanella violacea (strain JCM 10179 / CIP 106290 / LMG 19151 / DSS12) TaxID=637905 RepID=D4ZC90_SHEVD|nr:DUF2238 domain-containing protein [Shewanella violacea]BAJ03635.1 conserved hypothetical protein [Shewanella violacea DSS12]
MNKQLTWLVIFMSVLVWSAIEPKDPFTWFLEVLPALVALPVLFLTRERFPLTPLAYALILLHCIILMVGGHYTYAEVPVFDWIADITGSDRNNYDKLGHFAQGFVPTLVAREIFIRLDIVKPGGWCNFLSLCFALAFSAFYELIEWWLALLTGDNAEAFLGTQGYIWDTQSDMAMALLGGLIYLITLVKFHDVQLARFNV